MRGDVVEFRPDGVWIDPAGLPRFRFMGTAAEFLSVLVANPQIDVERARFLVRAPGVGGWFSFDGRGGSVTRGE